MSLCISIKFNASMLFLGSGEWKEMKASKFYPVPETLDVEQAYRLMCTLISRDCVHFCKYTKRHVCPGNQGTPDKLYLIQM